jgi:hypothetical protein
MTPTANHSPTVHPAHAEPAHSTLETAVRLRNAFTITSQRNSDGHEHHLITAPKHGPDRTRARLVIMAVLHHAHRHQHRVSFLITLGGYTRHSLRPQDGYDPGHVLSQCGIPYDDPYAWLQRQLLTTSPIDVNSIIGVEISTWHQPTHHGPRATSTR